MNLILERNQMVDLQLARRNISDERVLEAFRSVRREAFVPEKLVEFAYQDCPLPIADEQTISQPFIVALTMQALKLRGQERVLEVGTGSGYAAAILSHLAKEVHSVERLELLATQASQRLVQLGYRNVQVHRGDGTLGWLECAPYDAIAVAAGGPDVPAALLAQLAHGGRLVIPVGSAQSSQTLLLITREGDQFRRQELSEVRFVPLVGEQGWPGQASAQTLPQQPTQAGDIDGADSRTG
jgi:protein-L-isoaspartate(D-aspartate) O-methyltransferase